jgi:hypothetical protein
VLWLSTLGLSAILQLPLGGSLAGIVYGYAVIQELTACIHI